MKSERMSKVSILCPKHKSEEVIDKLHQMQILHIKDHIKTEEIDIGAPQEKGEKIAEILVKIRAIIGLLNLEPDNKKQDYGKDDFFKLGKKTRQIFDEIVKYNDLAKKGEEKLSLLKDRQKLLEILSELDISREELEDSGYLSRFIGSIADANAAKAKIKAITSRCQIQSMKVRDKEYIAIFADNKYENQIRDALTITGFYPTNINLQELSKKSIQEQIKEVKSDIKDAQNDIRDAQKELEGIKKENTQFILRNERFLKDEAKKAEVTLRFGATEKAFVINGWIPTKKLAKVEDELNKITNNKIHIETIKPEKDDNIPIRLKNPKPINSFEFFLDMFDLPNYKEIDPTFIMFLTFPLFFGIMLGDAGYGLVIMALFLFLRWKLPTLKKMINIMIFASILTIIFGVAYGEYFGFEHLSIEKGEQLCAYTGICLEKIELHEEGEENNHEKIEKEVSQNELNDIESDPDKKSIKNTEEKEEEISLPIKGESNFASSQIITVVRNGQTVKVEESNPIEVDEELKTLKESADSLEIEKITLEGSPEEKDLGALETESKNAEDEKANAETEEANIEEAREPTFVYDFPRILNRLHSKVNIAGFEVFTILVIGVLIGFIHLNFGLILGFINIYSKNGLMHAIEEKASWFLIQGGVILLALGYSFLLYIPILLIGIILLYMGEGIQGIVELPSIFSNMLSYMRLGALGLAGVGLAIVINEQLAMPFIEKGGIFIVIGVLIFIIGHTINIALGIIGPFLHSLRLHYVEFFSKFYKGGGLRYEPFGKDEEE